LGCEKPPIGPIGFLPIWADTSGVPTNELPNRRVVSRYPVEVEFENGGVKVTWVLMLECGHRKTILGAGHDHDKIPWDREPPKNTRARCKRCRRVT
jgi:hypothetical protein